MDQSQGQNKADPPNIGPILEGITHVDFFKTTGPIATKIFLRQLQHICSSEIFSWDPAEYSTPLEYSTKFNFLVKLCILAYFGQIWTFWIENLTFYACILPFMGMKRKKLMFWHVKSILISKITI